MANEDSKAEAIPIVNHNRESGREHRSVRPVG